MSISVGLFSTFMMFENKGDIFSVLFWDRVVYVGVVFIPVTMYHFGLAILNKTERYTKILLRVGYIASFLFLVMIPSDLFVDDIFFYKWGAHTKAKILHDLFLVYFFSYLLLWLVFVYRQYKITSLLEEKRKIKLVFLSFIILTGVGSLGFLPAYGISIYPFSYLSSFIFVIMLFYTISKHHLFDIKVIATELLTFALWFFILVRTLIANTLQDKLINGSLLVATVVLGVFLIRSVLKEVKTREKIELLAKDLEVANERLKELDQLKSEFVSIASHQLRSPLTAIKGYASLILEGSFGKAPPAIGEAVGKMLDSSSRLVLIIEDFLNLSRIEQGRMKYDFAPTDVETLVKSVVDELSPSIKTAGLSISFTTDNKPPYKSNLDVGKIKQVIGNIIDNSIKYTPRGSIQVSLKKETQNAKRVTYNAEVEGVQNMESQNDKILITVADTGIGISKETLPTLFEKFSRAKDASKTNTTGTGLGLYVAKQMVEAHGGKIWAESDGVGKGSSFKVELSGV